METEHTYTWMKLMIVTQFTPGQYPSVNLKKYMLAEIYQIRNPAGMTTRLCG